MGGPGTATASDATPATHRMETKPHINTFLLSVQSYVQRKRNLFSSCPRLATQHFLNCSIRTWGMHWHWCSSPGVSVVIAVVVLYISRLLFRKTSLNFSHKNDSQNRKDVFRMPRQTSSQRAALREQKEFDYCCELVELAANSEWVILMILVHWFELIWIDLVHWFGLLSFFLFSFFLPSV
jgi:hypothetical protein